MRPIDLKLKLLELNKPYKKNLKRLWLGNKKWQLKQPMRNKKRGRRDKNNCKLSGRENKILLSKRNKDRLLSKKLERPRLRDSIKHLLLKKKEQLSWKSKEKLKKLELRLNKKLRLSMLEKLNSNNLELLELRLSLPQKLTSRKLKN